MYLLSGFLIIISNNLMMLVTKALLSSNYSSSSDNLKKKRVKRQFFLNCHCRKNGLQSDSLIIIKAGNMFGKIIIARQSKIKFAHQIVNLFV
jgi:hypothetical protein